MKKTIEVLMWESDTNSSDGTPCYRIDEKGSGDRLFRDIKNNYDPDDNNTFEVVTMSPAEWRQCVKNGKDNA